MLSADSLSRCNILWSFAHYWNAQYTAHATATGAGRNGEVTSNDLTLKLASPAELGGTTKGENPEQLFAMGYACMRPFPVPRIIIIDCSSLPSGRDSICSRAYG